MTEFLQQLLNGLALGSLYALIALVYTMVYGVLRFINFAHSDIASLLDPWSTVGENIGYGPSVTSVFNDLVASSGHYNNMVDARFTSVGVGAYVDSTGRIWTAHIFGG